MYVPVPPLPEAVIVVLVPAQIVVLPVILTEGGEVQVSISQYSLNI